MREKLFKLKIEILQRLVQAAKDRDGAKLWHDCLTILTDNLSAEEVAFLMRMDRFFADLQPGDEFTYSPMQGQVVYRIAGLTDLLEVIGHYEQELTIGHMNRVSEALMDLPSDIALSSYYEIIGKSWRGVVDRALCRLLVGSGADRFWEMYGQRVNHALKTELYDEEALREQLKRNLAQKRGVLESAISEMVGGILESPKEVQERGRSEIENALGLGDYVFQRRGEIWVVKYGKKGEMFFLEHSAGLDYIHVLLSHPWTRLPVLLLFELLEKPEPDTRADIFWGMYKDKDKDEDEDEVVGLGISDLGDAGEKSDRQARAEYKRELRYLYDKLDQAREYNDIGAAAEAQERIQIIEGELVRAYGLSGRSRRDCSAVERARLNIRNQIVRVWSRIKEKDLSLWVHLHNSIKTGRFCIYKPPESIPWTL